MVFPRLAAAIFVLLVIGSLALLLVVGVNWLGPVLAHGSTAQHAQGKITAIGPGKDFVLRTAAGESMRFQCRDICRASLSHMQRHLQEKATTDVYFVQDAGNVMVAVDVD